MKTKISLAFVLALFTALSPAFAQTHNSGLKRITGFKFPNSAAEGKEPVAVTVNTLMPGERAGGYSELLPFSLLAPDQEEAGSCLYMTLTGVAEFYLARQNPRLSRAPDGPLDLSERHLMNIA